MPDNPTALARIRLEHGARWPYDAPDAWWEAIEQPTLAPHDWAHAAARGILADLQGRRGIKWHLQEVAQDVRVELVEALAEIIREAHRAR